MVPFDPWAKEIQSMWENMLAEPVIDVRRVKIECPTCGKEQYVKLRVESLVARNGVVSLVIKAACDHEFNLYLDKHFQVRGYERIDAVVSAEMMQVDQEISDFMKDEGIKERSSGKFLGKLRNDLDRDRHLETIIRYFRGADVAGTYWIESIAGSRPEPARVDPTKAFPLPPLPSFPAPPAANRPDFPPPPPVAATAPTAEAVSPSPAPKSKPVEAAPKAGLKGLPVPRAKSPPVDDVILPAPVAVDTPACQAKAQVEVEPAVAPEPVVPVASEGAEEGQEAEAMASPAPAESPEVPEITLDELRAQFESRVKKINDLMIKLELENLNETVSDVALVKKKAKLAKLKEDLEVQFNKIVSEKGLDKPGVEKAIASSA